MKLLGLDPSSKRTGYAVMDGPTAILEAGYLRPDNARAEALARIKSMAEALDGLLHAFAPDLAVVEVGGASVSDPSRKGYGLVTLGVAMGAMWWTAETMVDRVVAVDERTWTGGERKSTRQKKIAALFPDYRRHIATDPGGDISDAIGLALWWYREQRIRRVSQ